MFKSVIPACLFLSLFVAQLQAQTNISGPITGLPTANVSVYPNPTVSQLTISADIPASEVTGIQVMDMTGKMLFSMVPTPSPEPIKITVDMGDYPMGIYLVKIASKNGTATRKVIKQS